MPMRPTSFQILPPVIKNILIINGLFLLGQFVLGHSFGIELSDYLGLHYFFSTKFRVYQLVTYMFLHEGFAHLLSNMFALWMFGATLENYWGPKRFLTFYLATGIGAALTHYAVYAYQIYPLVHEVNQVIANAETISAADLSAFFKSEHFKVVSQGMQNSLGAFANDYQSLEVQGLHRQTVQLVTDFFSQYKQEIYDLPVVIGASGSVFGILLAFGMLFPNTLLYLYFAIPVKAKYFVFFYGLFELFEGLSNNPGDNVAHFAHLGGMLFGFLLIRRWNKNDRQHFY